MIDKEDEIGECHWPVLDGLVSQEPAWRSTVPDTVVQLNFKAILFNLDFLIINFQANKVLHC